MLRFQKNKRANSAWRNIEGEGWGTPNASAWEGKEQHVGRGWWELVMWPIRKTICSLNELFQNWWSAWNRVDVSGNWCKAWATCPEGSRKGTKWTMRMMLVWSLAMSLELWDNCQTLSSWGVSYGSSQVNLSLQGAKGSIWHFQYISVAYPLFFPISPFSLSFLPKSSKCREKPLQTLKVCKDQVILREIQRRQRIKLEIFGKSGKIDYVQLEGGTYLKCPCILHIQKSA